MAVKKVDLYFTGILSNIRWWVTDLFVAAVRRILYSVTTLKYRLGKHITSGGRGSKILYLKIIEHFRGVEFSAIRGVAS